MYVERVFSIVIHTCVCNSASVLLHVCFVSNIIYYMIFIFLYIYIYTYKHKPYGLLMHSIVLISFVNLLYTSKF